MIPPEQLTDAVRHARGVTLLPVPVKAWPVGASVRCGAYAGRVTARVTDADTADGHWRTVLLIKNGGEDGD